MNQAISKDMDKQKHQRFHDIKTLLGLSVVFVGAVSVVSTADIIVAVAVLFFVSRLAGIAHTSIGALNLVGLVPLILVVAYPDSIAAQWFDMP